MFEPSELTKSLPARGGWVGRAFQGFSQFIFAVAPAPTLPNTGAK